MYSHAARLTDLLESHHVGNAGETLSQSSNSHELERKREEIKNRERKRKLN